MSAPVGTRTQSVGNLPVSASDSFPDTTLNFLQGPKVLPSGSVKGLQLTDRVPFLIQVYNWFLLEACDWSLGNSCTVIGESYNSTSICIPHPFWFYNAVVPNISQVNQETLPCVVPTGISGSI